MDQWCEHKGKTMKQQRKHRVKSISPWTSHWILRNKDANAMNNEIKIEKSDLINIRNLWALIHNHLENYRKHWSITYLTSIFYSKLS